MNDARYFDWPEGLRRYIDTIRQGRGQSPKQYSARYVCSLVSRAVRPPGYARAWNLALSSVVPKPLPNPAALPALPLLPANSSLSVLHQNLMRVRLLR